MYLLIFVSVNMGLGGIRFVGDLDICDRLVMPKAKH